MKLKQELQQQGVLYLVVIGLIVASLSVFVQDIIIIDTAIANKIYNLFSSQVVTLFFNIISDWGTGSIYTGLFIGLLLLIKIKKKPFFFLFSYLVLIFIRLILQFVFSRPRPFILDNNHSYLGDQLPFGSSFPSFHAMSAFFIAYILSALFKLNKKVIISLYFLAFLVGVSRIYLGAHYPIDVIAGGVIGLLWGHICVLYFERNNRQ